MFGPICDSDGTAAFPDRSAPCAHGICCRLLASAGTRSLAFATEAFRRDSGTPSSSFQGVSPGGNGWDSVFKVEYVYTSSTIYTFAYLTLATEPSKFCTLSRRKLRPPKVGVGCCEAGFSLPECAILDQ